MKPFILALVFISNSVFGIVYNLSNSFSVDIPSDWTISYQGAKISVNSPSFTHILEFQNLTDIVYSDSDSNSSSSPSVYFSDIDSLNGLMKPYLLVLDFEVIEKYSSIWNYRGMTSPSNSSNSIIDYQFYEANASSGSYYVAQSHKLLNFVSTTNGGNINFSAQSYIFWDGESFFALTALQETGLSIYYPQERVEFTSVLASVTSSFIISPYGDLDGDGLYNKDEILYLGSSPYLNDTNGDGMGDGEVAGLGGHPKWELTQTFNFIEQNPSRFNLVSQSDYNAALANSSGFSLDEIKDLRAGSTMIEIHNGQATLTMEVEESDDLGIWTNGGASTLQIPIDAEAGKKFFRFKMAE